MSSLIERGVAEILNKVLGHLVLGIDSNALRLSVCDPPSPRRPHKGLTLRGAGRSGMETFSCLTCGSKQMPSTCFSPNSHSAFLEATLGKSH